MYYKSFYGDQQIYLYPRKIAEGNKGDAITQQAVWGCVSRRWHFLAREGDNKSPQFLREGTRGVAYIRNGAPLSFLGTWQIRYVGGAFWMRPGYPRESTEEMRKAERWKDEEIPSFRSLRSFLPNEGWEQRALWMMGAPNREGFRSIMSYRAILTAIRRDFQWPIRFVQERTKDRDKTKIKVEMS